MAQDRPPLKLIGGRRVPVGALSGCFRSLHAPILAARAAGAAGEAAGIAPQRVSQVFLGSMFSAGLGPNPAQRVAAESGLGEDPLCMTIKAGGASALAAALACGALLEGDALGLVGGMDSASTQPYLVPAARLGSRLGAGRLVDGAHAEALTGEDDVPLNVMAAMAAQRLELDEEALDRAALAARSKGADDPTRVSMDVIMRREVAHITEDEAPGPRPSPLIAPLADGAAAFFVSRDPELTGVELLAWSRAAETANRTPIAPASAAAKVLKAAGVKASELSAMVIDESLGVAPSAAARELGVDLETINPFGGSQSRGFPGAACAAIALVQLCHRLSETGGLGLISYGTGVGGALALLLRA